MPLERKAKFVNQPTPKQGCKIIFDAKLLIKNEAIITFFIVFLNGMCIFATETDL